MAEKRRGKQERHVEKEKKALMMQFSSYREQEKVEIKDF